MYRDDPLDDELELRDLLGDEAVDALVEAAGAHASDEHGTPLEAALDALRVLQGWVDDGQAARWFLESQQRLGSRTPVEALVAGDADEVVDVARRWAAAQG